MLCRGHESGLAGAEEGLKTVVGLTDTGEGLKAAEEGWKVAGDLADTGRGLREVGNLKVAVGGLKVVGEGLTRIAQGLKSIRKRKLRKDERLTEILVR